MTLHSKCNKTLQIKIERYMTGEISAAELKHVTAPLGIYRQRNAMFMMRIRVSGGHLTLEKLTALKQIMIKYQLNYAHLTSRQAIQLHDVAAADIVSIINELTEAGMPFIGGGGNTYRNLLVSSDAGLGINETFDVSPYANALNSYMLNESKAFELPRKLKIGISSGIDNTINAQFQDLGFIAKTVAGKPGFEVYGGGGMGRETKVGIKLFDFIPATELLTCAKAMLDLFYDHGNRENRNEARLRFVVKRLGNDKFIELFNQYFNNTSAPTFNFKSNTESIINKFQQQTAPQLDKQTTVKYNFWKQYAVKETKFTELFLVRLFVPYGNLTIDDLTQLIKTVAITGSDFIRLTQTQDILLPAKGESTLRYIFDLINKHLKNRAFLLNSFKGHLTACVGAEVCSIGIANSRLCSDAIAEQLNLLFKTNSTQKLNFIIHNLDTIRISGCQNACSGHPVAAIGIQGMKKRIAEALQEGAVISPKYHNNQENSRQQQFMPTAAMVNEVIKLLTK
jgi:sulfite reductase beta subunit-like hemoprotein